MTPGQLRLFLFGFGAFVTICGYSAFRQGQRGAYEVQDWTPAEATVLDSRIVRSTRSRGTGGSSVDVYSPLITYRYTFGGGEYENDRYSLHDPCGEDRASKMAIVDRHPAGSKVTAYVNPDDGGESVLSREREPAIAIMIAGGVFGLAGAGLLAAVLVLTLRRAQQPRVAGPGDGSSEAST